MQCSTGCADREQAIIDLVSATFTASDGTAEGDSVGRLVADLVSWTPQHDVVVCCGEDESGLLGCIVFSRVRYDDDGRTVFMLAPVAVRTDRQGQGIGQRLLRFGLQQMRDANVDCVLTYGNPDYYAKVGFAAISEVFARAPHRLTQPHGWLAQSLTGQALLPLRGACRCVPALDRPEYW